jgi:hypothetical protein
MIGEKIENRGKGASKRRKEERSGDERGNNIQRGEEGE